MRLSGHGVAVDLPAGWEGTIATPAQSRPGSRTFSLDDPERPLPVAHLANFALPPGRGDFGSGAVEVMTASDALVALLEYGHECVDTALFDQAPPRAISASELGPRSLQRALPGHVGLQRFFTTGGRAFCLYVVLAGGATPEAVAAVNRVLARLQVTDREETS